MPPPDAEQSFLAEASRALAASINPEQTLRTIARIAVPRLADRAAVDMVDDDGHLRRVGVAGTDPAAAELLQEIRRRYPFDPSRPHPALRAVETGQPALLPEVDDEQLARLAQDDQHLAMLRRLGIRSAVSVPLVARGRVLGAITLSRVDGSPRYTEADLQLAEELAGRAALAVDNARLYEHAQLQARRVGLLAEASR